MIILGKLLPEYVFPYKMPQLTLYDTRDVYHLSYQKDLRTTELHRVALKLTELWR